VRRVFALVGAAFLLVAPPQAHADDAGYLAELQSDGVMMLNRNFWVINGHRMCDMLHSGIAPETLYDQFGLQNAQGPQIVTAAQHNLCPDTLH
jgi:hypothetical protein